MTPGVVPKNEGSAREIRTPPSEGVGCGLRVSFARLRQLAEQLGCLTTGELFDAVFPGALLDEGGEVLTGDVLAAANAVDSRHLLLAWALLGRVMVLARADLGAGRARRTLRRLPGLRRLPAAVELEPDAEK